MFVSVQILENLNITIQKTKKYALVDKPGADLGDFADLGGDAMVILPDLITTIFTAGASKAIGGGAVMAGAGEYTRLKIGQCSL